MQLCLSTFVTALPQSTYSVQILHLSSADAKVPTMYLRSVVYTHSVHSTLYRTAPLPHRGHHRRLTPSCSSSLPPSTHLQSCISGVRSFWDPIYHPVRINLFRVSSFVFDTSPRPSPHLSILAVGTTKASVCPTVDDTPLSSSLHGVVITSLTRLPFSDPHRQFIPACPWQAGNADSASDNDPTDVAHHTACPSGLPIRNGVVGHNDFGLTRQPADNELDAFEPGQVPVSLCIPFARHPDRSRHDRLRLQPPTQPTQLLTLTFGSAKGPGRPKAA